MRDSTSAVILLLLTIALTAFAVLMILSSDIKEAAAGRKLIRECEAVLPRDQYCKLTAEPDQL